MTRVTAPRRHDLVWLDRAFARSLAAPLGRAEAAAVEAWVARGLPLVARRADPGAPGAVALGLSLPPGAPLRRLGLAVKPEAVKRVAPPLTLRSVLRSAPAAWRRPLTALDRDARRAGLLLRVFGSLALHHLAHGGHLHDRSDVDLLVRPEGPTALRRALALLAARAEESAPRLDGEVVVEDGAGIAWRELLARPPRVLVKGPAGPRLAAVEEALGRLAEGTR